MAIYSAASAPSWTPTVVLNTTAMTASGFQTIRGGGATQRVNVLEIYEGGQATSSAPMWMLVGRNATVGTTPTALTMALLDANAAASATVPVNYQTAPGGQPGRSSTLGYLLNLSFNAFGGIVRWYKGPEETLSLYGTAADAGEISLSAYTGSTVGPMGSHFIIEAV